MKRFIQGESREQVTLLPECLDDDIGQDNPVRIVDALIEELDLLSLGFSGADPAPRAPCVPAGCAAQALQLRRSEPHPVQPPP